MVAFPTGRPHVRRASFLPSWFVPNPNILSGPNKSPSSCGKQQPGPFGLLLTLSPPYAEEREDICLAARP